MTKFILNLKGIDVPFAEVICAKKHGGIEKFAEDYDDFLCVECYETVMDMMND